jgi:hypothetical protein
MDYHLGAEGETENNRNGYLPIPTLEVLPTTSHLGWAATSIQRCSLARPSQHIPSRVRQPRYHREIGAGGSIWLPPPLLPALERRERDR